MPLLGRSFSRAVSIANYTDPNVPVDAVYRIHSEWLLRTRGPNMGHGFEQLVTQTPVMTSDCTIGAGYNMGVRTTVIVGGQLRPPIKIYMFYISHAVHVS